MRYLCVLAALSLATLSCASPFGALGLHELALSLPVAPEAWSCLGDLRMEVIWKPAGGGLGSVLAAPGSRLRVEVARGVPQGILAYPVSAGRRLLPAGAIYPEALSAAGGKRDGADMLALDWPGGYAASVAAELAKAGIEPWAYDLSRLASQAVGRCSDPWRIPCLEAARRLSSLEFRMDAYSCPALTAVVLPGPGPWAPESPFEPAPAPAGKGWAASLSEGLWRFVSPEGELVASVGADGSVACVRDGRQCRVRPRRMAASRASAAVAMSPSPSSEWSS